ncbi:MAG: ABC transporter substrate-binding protein [Burkholderiaceae bacterium]|nr:ABC transporter substrate-binding protein [Burkholderiaceae bacterium]
MDAPQATSAAMPRPPHTALRSATALRRRCVLLLGVLGPWLSGGCSPPAPLRLVGHPWPGHEPFFLAQHLGYLPAQPLLQLQETATLQESLQRLRESRADGAMLPLSDVLQLRDEGLKLQVVLVFDVSRGADMLLMQTGLRGLSTLRGQRVAVDPSSQGTLMLQLALEKAGLQAGDVQIERLPYEQHELAWERRDVHALVTHEPVASRLLARGAYAALDTRQLPDTLFHVLAVRSDVLPVHGDTLRAALAGYFQALDYQRRNPWDAAYRMAPRLRLSAEALLEAMRGLEQPDRLDNRRYLADTDSALQRIALQLAPLMQRAGLLRRPVSLLDLDSGDYLPRS